MGTVTIAAQLAEDQLGLVTRTQMLDAGVRRKTLEEAVRTGALVRMERSVYRVPGAPVGPNVRLLAAMLTLGHGTLLSHRSAAWLWGLAPAPRPHEVSVPRGRRRRASDLVVHESMELPASDSERMVTNWLTQHGVTGWSFHHRIVVPELGPVELDVAWPALRVALELEGADHRDRRLVHDRDTERQNRLTGAGWVVLRLTYRRWLHEPAAVLDELESLLRRAAA